MGIDISSIVSGIVYSFLFWAIKEHYFVAK